MARTRESDSDPYHFEAVDQLEVLIEELTAKGFVHMEDEPGHYRHAADSTRRATIKWKRGQWRLCIPGETRYAPDFLSGSSYPLRAATTLSVMKKGPRTVRAKR